MITDVKQCCI